MADCEMCRLFSHLPQYDSGRCECQKPPKPPDPLSELRELETWKTSQLKVESVWDEQAVGRLLGVPLGQSIRAAIQPSIEKLQQRVAELEGQTKHFETVVKLLSKEVLRLGGHDIEQIKREVANRKQRKRK